MKNVDIYDLTHAVHIIFEKEKVSERWRIKAPRKRWIRKDLPERAVNRYDSGWMPIADFEEYDRAHRDVYVLRGKKVMIRSTVTVFFSNRHKFKTKFDTHKEAIEFLLKHGKAMGLPFVYVEGDKIPTTGFLWDELDKELNLNNDE